MLGSLLFMKVVEVVSWGCVVPWRFLNTVDLVLVAKDGAELGQK